MENILASHGPDEEQKRQQKDVAPMVSQALVLTRHNRDQPGWIELLNFVISFTTVTCGWRPLRGYNHWDEILPGDDEVGPLFLGGLPIESNVPGIWNWHGGHADKLNAQCEAQGHALGLVVSMVREFEAVGSGLMVYPVSPEGWVKRGVEYASHPMEDFTVDIEFEDLKTIADTIHRRRTRGIGPEADAEPDGRKGAYVHCKAGVGRSLLATWAYLVLHCEMTVEAAEALLRQKRPQVAITSTRRDYIRQFAAHYLGDEPPAILAANESALPESILPSFTKSRSMEDLLALTKTFEALQLEENGSANPIARRNSFSI